MNFRKILCGVMASAMAVSMSANVFAAEITDVDTLNEGTEIEVTGETKTAAIKLTVPTSASIVLNPYGLDVELDADTTVQDQVISAVQHIQNESDLAVKVTTTVTGTIAGSAKFAEATVNDAETEKLVYLEFGVKAVADDSATTLPNDANKKALSTTAVKWEKTDGADDTITLDKKGGTNTYMVFGFTGDASKNPTTAWTSEDVVGATIAFSFALDNSAAGGGSGDTEDAG